jgi:hypothetical protein
MPIVCGISLTRGLMSLRAAKVQPVVSFTGFAPPALADAAENNFLKFLSRLLRRAYSLRHGGSGAQPGGYHARRMSWQSG